MESQALDRAQTALREREQFFRLLMESSSDFIRLHELTGHTIYNSPSTTHLLGYSPESMLVVGIPEDAARAQAWWERVVNGSSEALEWRIRNAEGCIRWMETRPFHITYEGRPHVLTFCRDVTDRKNAEAESREHAWFFESLDRINRVIQGAVDVEQMMRDVLDTTIDVFDADQAGFAHPADPDAPEWDIPMFRARDEYVPTLEASRTIERTPDGVEMMRVVRESDGPVRFGPGEDHPLPDIAAFRLIKSFLGMAIYPKGEKPYFFGVAQARAARHWTSAEERLFGEIGHRLADALTSLSSIRRMNESHSLFDAVVNGTSDSIYVKDVNGCYLLVNDAGLHMLDKRPSEIVGKDDTELFPPETARLIAERDRAAMESGVSQTYEETLTIRGSRHTFVTTKSAYRDASGRVLGLIGISSDVTEMKRLESQLLHSQRLEAVGKLAGGVAHDFNNLLTVITGYGSMHLATLPPTAESRRAVEEILSAAYRGASLTRQLLAFSRQQVLRPRAVDLNQTVTSTSGMLRRVVGEDIILRTELAADVWWVHADAGQLEQVIMNLVVNARDAMPNGGVLRIRTANAQVDADDASMRPGFVAGEYATLVVEDTGTGIAADVLPRMFEPFFTTKAPGKGTGLGLATVYGIVKQSDGYIYVDTTPGKGTRFTVYLPRHDLEQSPVPAEVPTAASHGAETILLVEDEDDVRTAVRLMLTRLGYHVIEAGSGAEALRLAAEADLIGERIDLVLTDVVMSEQSGRVLGERLASHWPNLKVLYMSGYTDDEIIRRGLVLPGAGFLEKPFTPQRLGEVVRRALDTHPRDSRACQDPG